MTSEKRLLPRVLLAAICAAAGTTAIAATPALAAGVGGRNLPAPKPAGQTLTGTEILGSFNWSGWAQSAPAGTFKSANDNWQVPVVNTALSGDQFSSDWVGIGGLHDSTLVQAGTEADNFNGTALYRAWTEILPEAENPLPMEIHPGDKIKTTIAEIKPGVWKMTVDDKTTKRKESRTQSYAGSTHASVETIHERPCIMAPCNSTADLAELTQTTNVTFDPGRYGVGKAAKTGLMVLAPGGTDDQIFMLDNTGTKTIASPSAEDSDHDGFAVADGEVSPAPPKS